MQPILLIITAVLLDLKGSTASESVSLTSTLNSDRIVYPLVKVTFTCTTRGSNIQEWYSDAYITGIDDRIQLHEGRHTGSGRAANATVISITTENGSKVIVSQLCILTSTQYLMPTVSCGNNGLGVRKNITFAIQAVILNGTLEHLRGEYVAYPQQTVYFTCTTTGSNIQEWYSPEYITGIDDRIQLHEGRHSGSGRAANATIISVTINELGEKVIVSLLSLIASTHFPVSTVSCGNNGHGMRDNIVFRIQTVKLNSTLESAAQGYLAYPQQRVNFTCTTIGSNIQEWYSSEYITGIDDRIQLHEGRRSGSGRAANATITSVTTNEIGEKVIVSQLSLIASTQYAVSTVSCGNNGQGMRDNTTFNMTDPPAPTIDSTLRPEGYACPGEKINFTCVTLDSNHQSWTSDNYTSEDLHIWPTLPIGQQKNSIRFPHTSAVLASISEENGRLRLISHLTITVPEQRATNQIHSVMCSHMMGSSSISFQIADPETCNVVTSRNSDVTTTRQIVASGEEIKHIEIYVGVPVSINLLLITIAASIVIYTYITRRKSIAKVRVDQESGRSNEMEKFTESQESSTCTLSSQLQECSSVTSGTGRDGLPTNASDA